MSERDIYSQMGVSVSKKFLHEILGEIEGRVNENTFCKVLKLHGGTDPYVCCLHSDTAGTKTLLHYLYWRDTGDLSMWKYIAWDALAMNINDIACTGFTSKIIVNSIISRNTFYIPDEVIREIINGFYEAIEILNGLGLDIKHGGGETADVNDIIRTVDVGASVFSFTHESMIIKINISRGNYVVGIPSWGKTYYEPFALSGISCNGITALRHLLLSHQYRKYQESYETSLPQNLIYSGTITMDNITNEWKKELLSPTRFISPILHRIIKELGKEHITGIVHLTGGAHSKVLKFIKNKPLQISKKINTEKDIPPIFKIIMETNKMKINEMFKVFNMGYSIDIYTDSLNFAEKITKFVREEYGLSAFIYGYVEDALKPSVKITINGHSFIIE